MSTPFDSGQVNENLYTKDVAIFLNNNHNKKWVMNREILNSYKYNKSKFI